MEAALVSDYFQGDLNLAPIPFDKSSFHSGKKLRIGYYDTDEWFEPCLTSKRAVKEAVVALQTQGHECVPFVLPTDGWHSYGLLVAINAAEGNFRSYIEALEGEQMISEYNLLATASNLPSFFRWLLLKVLDKRRGHLLSKAQSGGISAYDVWQLTADLLELRTTWSDSMVTNNLDAIVHPAMPIPAMKHGRSGELTSSCSYMFMSNMLMWPCGTVPVTTVRPDEAHYRNCPAEQDDAIARRTAQIMEDSAGLPIGVSVMTAAYQDEICLKVMRCIERNVCFSEKPTAFLND
jgi:fatty acid amide hydrolase